MRPFSLLLVAVVVVALPLHGQGVDLAPSGTLRAAFIADNPVQGRVDPQTGAVTGFAGDLTRELARRLGVPHTIAPLPSAGAVLESVNTRKADIGFLAYEAERAQQVDFSAPYVLSTSTYLVRADSSIRSSGDVDRAGVKIGAVKEQSQQIYISANTRSARVEILPAAPSADAIAKMLLGGKLDAFGGNRQRMEEAARQGSSKLRVLADNFMITAQAIVVEKGQRSRLDQINKFLNELRASGFLKASLDRAKLEGVEVAPAGFVPK